MTAVDPKTLPLIDVVLTRYALSGPMTKIKARDRGTDVYPSCRYEYRRKGHLADTAGANHVALTEAEATKHFEEMRARKIKSLQKQIAKLEKMKPTFDTDEGVP